MNIVEVLLKELKVNHSHKFIEDNYLNAPDSDNMLGIQRILSRYGIESVGVHFKNKEEAGITFPCVLHWGNYAVVGVDIDRDEIKYYFDGHYLTEKISQFNKKWTGDALFITDKKNAKEPSYFRNKIIDLYNHLVCSFLFVLIMCIGFLPFVRTGVANLKSINMIFDLLGFFVCIMLFQKQINKGSSLSDKVCSLLQKGGCDSVLETDEAKFLGIISWSEIGLAYFTSRIVFGSLYDSSISLLQIVGWLAMPYGVWSIWFQAIKSKHWCTLCCLVQAIIWISGIYNAFNITYSENFILGTVIYTISGITSFIFIQTLAKLHSVNGRFNHISKDYIELKLDKDVFKTTLLRSMEVNNAESSIIYGNMSASVTLTVLTNPHCEPCARMHKRLLHVMNANPNINIQYIYSSFDEDVESSSLFCIAVYQQKTYEEALKILEAWYQYGRFQRKTFIEKSGVNIFAPEVTEEYSKHKIWQDRSGISSTPTIVYNGHVIPKYYYIEDFIYLDSEVRILT